MQTEILWIQEIGQGGNPNPKMQRIQIKSWQEAIRVTTLIQKVPESIRVDPNPKSIEIDQGSDPNPKSMQNRLG